MLNWEDILLRAEDNVRHALRVIDIGSVRTAFVVDEERRLVGAITDGDIRRGLLNNLNMDDSISMVMNKSPVSCLESDSIEDIRSKLIVNDIQCMPILKNGRLIGVETLISLNKPAKRENPVFIMAGGFGTRLKPLTDNCPKPMLPVGEKPMLEHIITRMANQGFENFYLSTHYLPGMIKKHFGDGSPFNVKIHYVHESEPLGTGGALGLLPNELPNLPVIMLNGDVLTDLNFNRLLEFHNKNEFDATMCLREIEHQISYGVVETEGYKVVGMKEKPTYVHDINTGIYCLSISCVKSIEKGIKIDMPAYLENRLIQGNTVGAMRHSGYWLDIGKMTDYQKAQRDINELLDN